MEIKRTYIKTDRNGTKYYEVECQCWKCGGTGRIPQFNHVEGGICFECGGCGKEFKTIKEYTPEWEARLAERRAKKLAKMQYEADKKAAEEINKMEAKVKATFPELKAYFVLGNTYPIKNELKAKGAKFDWYNRMWYFTHKVDGYELFEVDINEKTFNKYYFEFNDLSLSIKMYKKFREVN